jgi:hypothetical protein
MPAVPIAEQIKEVGREIGLRRNVYAKRVHTKDMDQAEADQRIANMEAVLATLKWVDRHRDRLRQLAAELPRDPEQAEQVPYDAGPATQSTTGETDAKAQ